MTGPTLIFADLLRDTTAVHLTRAMLTPARPKSLHTHDFYEVFWVQNGSVRHHLADHKTTLAEGDIVFLAPGQWHALQGRGEQALVVSLCLRPDVIDGLVARYPQLRGRFFWGDAPFVMTRSIRQMTALNQAALQLERSTMDALAAESFVLPLLSDLTADTLPDDVPGWLRDACLSARDPDVFRNGSAGLVALSGYAHAHVSRAMRRYMNQTPSDYINGLRMDYAARALVTDAAPLPDIAAATGIPNLSHFHKVFRKYHGVTPLKYRQHYQRDVVQP